MAEHLPAVPDGGAVVPHSGGGAVAVPDDVGDLSVDRGAANRVVQLAPAAAARRTALIADWQRQCGMTDQQRERTLAWLQRHGPEFEQQRSDGFVAQRVAIDKRDKEAGIAALRGAWGADYESNIQRVKGWMATLPEALSEAVLYARDSDLTPICSLPEVLQAMLEVASRRPATATPPPYVPRQTGGDAAAAARKARIREIETEMREHYHRYIRDPELQQEYRDLLDQGAE